MDTTTIINEATERMKRTVDHLDEEQAAYQLYASNYIPRCFVIGRDGVVVYSGVGYDEAVAAEVKEAIDKALL